MGSEMCIRDRNIRYSQLVSIEPPTSASGGLGAEVYLEFTAIELAVSPADINADGFVDFADFAVMASNWFSQDCSPEQGYCQNCDMYPYDGSVNFFDLDILMEYWLDDFEGYTVEGALLLSPVSGQSAGDDSAIDAEWGR